MWTQCLHEKNPNTLDNDKANNNNAHYPYTSSTFPLWFSKTSALKVLMQPLFHTCSCNTHKARLQENVVFLTQKATTHDTCVRYTLSFHPLQCIIHVVYCGVYYIKMTIYAILVWTPCIMHRCVISTMCLNLL